MDGHMAGMSRALTMTAVTLAVIASCRCASPAGARAAGPAFELQPSVAQPALTAQDTVLVGAGDIASCDSDDDEATARMVEQVLAQTHPDSRAFTAGDNAYPSGTVEQFERCYMPTWGRFVKRTLAVPGNHDWRTSGAQGFRATFFGGDQAQPFWRSADVGGWHVVLLDADCDKVGGCEPGSAQYAWLERDLAESQHPCTVAIWHHPLFSSGKHGSDPRMRAVWDLLDRHGADVVLNGHDHQYERLAAMHADGSPGGMRSFVVGTGGAHAYAFETVLPASEARLTGAPAVFALVLGDGQYRWQLLGVDGNVLDAGAAVCR
jgi:alkaline phosphatase